MGPDLDNKTLFDCRPGVPILDTHTRGERVVDQAKLELVAHNSNARAAKGEFGLMFIGHTRDDVPEKDQPPLAGYLRNYRMGQHNGRPCILADTYYRRDRPEALEFPRRSVEVYYSERDAASNYIDALALLKTSPERDLGLVTYKSQGKVRERYSMADSNPSQQSLTEADIDALKAFMSRRNITDVGMGIRAYLQAKADGTAQPADDDFGKDDVEKLAKFCRVEQIDTSRPGGYETGLARYKKARREGKL